MENSLHIAAPVALARPRGAHRFEAFSPKLARRMTFYRRALLEQWVLLEADPRVITFCERPGYVQINGHNRLADFWVRYVDRDELVLLEDNACGGDATKPDRTLDAHTLSIRQVVPAELSAARIWIENWQRMLPCLVANRGLVPPTLPRTVVRFTRQPQRLLDIEREFSTGDPVLVRAAVFGLLHNGPVGAPELRTQPLSLRSISNSCSNPSGSRTITLSRISSRWPSNSTISYGRVYERLVWSMRSVGHCPRHRCRLAERCPECGYQQTGELSPLQSCGFCSRCQGWLGTDEPDPMFDRQTAGRDYEVWAAQSLANLVAHPLLQ